MVTVCLNNGKLLKLMQQKRVTEISMALEQIDEAK